MLPATALAHLRRAEVILHAGDVLEQWFLDELAELAPVHAVLGNNDTGLDLPERLEVDLEGVRVGMVHDSGARTGREARLARWFPSCQLVVFGHSHAPLDTRGQGVVVGSLRGRPPASAFGPSRAGPLPSVQAEAAAPCARQRLLNPGSPTDKRTQPHHTLALVDLDDARIRRTQIVDLD